MISRARFLLPAMGLAIVPVSLTAQARSLTIGGAARLAAERSATAVVSRERANQRGAVVRQTRASLLPSLTTDALIDGGTDTPIPSALGGPNGLTSLGLDRTLDMRVKLTQPLLDLGSVGKWKASIADADAAHESARYDEDRAAEDGALAYLRVLRAEARLAARVADSTLAAELLDIARQQLQAGTSIALDVTRAESQLASATSQLIKARNERARMELQMLRSLGLSIDSRVEFADSLRDPHEQDLAVDESDAIRSALNRRGDVRAAQAASLSAQRSIKATRMERLPTVAAFAQAASNGNGALDAHTYGIQVSLPIFDGLRREGRIQEAQAREREAEAQYEDARRLAEVEVRSALLDLDAAREQVTAARVQLGLAEREVAQARDRFTNGVAGNADVINAQLSLNGARDVVVEALASYHAARVNLAGAQGATVEMP
jgi:outer membrane protein TolC